MAECVEHLEGKVTPHHEVFMKTGIKYLGDAYLPAASNAAYMCGKLCEYCPQQSLQFYQELCEWSSRLLSQKKLGDATDNAVAMLVRMIMANFDKVPLDKMLPAIITNLPIKDDQEESAVVYPFLAQLILGKHQDIALYIPNIVHIFAYLLGSDDLEDIEAKDSILELVVKTLLFLITEFPQQMEQILTTLQPEQQQRILQLMKSQ
jgi:hypothetical protein